MIGDGRMLYLRSSSNRTRAENYVSASFLNLVLGSKSNYGSRANYYKELLSSFRQLSAPSLRGPQNLHQISLRYGLLCGSLKAPHVVMAEIAHRDRHCHSRFLQRQISLLPPTRSCCTILSLLIEGEKLRRLS